MIGEDGVFGVAVLAAWQRSLSLLLAVLRETGRFPPERGQALRHQLCATAALVPKRLVQCHRAGRPERAGLLDDADLALHLLGECAARGRREGLLADGGLRQIIGLAGEITTMVERLASAA